MAEEALLSGWGWGWFRVGETGSWHACSDCIRVCVTPYLSIHSHNWPNENIQRIVFPLRPPFFFMNRFSGAGLRVHGLFAPLSPLQWFWVTFLYPLLLLFAGGHHCCHSCNYVIVFNTKIVKRWAGEDTNVAISHHQRGSPSEATCLKFGKSVMNWSKCLHICQTLFWGKSIHLDKKKKQSNLFFTVSEEKRFLNWLNWLFILFFKCPNN